ncbi:MAG: periplasmic heavy metal sensor [Bacteroidales bacterium]|nr:periplasmic heavy metal sensor [Bacteroidales bacterium]
MKREKVILLLATTFMLTTISLSAQRGPGYGQGTPEGNHMLKGIPDLSEDQMDQIKDLHTAHLKDIKPLKNDVKINNAILDALQTEDEPDLGKINELIEENGKLLTDIRKKQVAHKMEIRSLLTDDQKVFFDNKMQRMRIASKAKFQGGRMGAHPGMGYHRGNW